MRRPLASILALLAFVGGPTTRLMAQDAVRPTVGLVLGGGGARGGAHVGVLRVLEELRVPVDMIVGTSMGAIVGGAYASGMGPDEIETLLGTIDWDELFRTTPPRRDLTFRRKQDTRRLLIDVEIGFDGTRFRLPPSLIGGHGLNLLLKEVTLPVADVTDFDRLPIPYRALATDVESGDLVVISEGELSRAILASMAIPGAFEPIEIDGRLLVDGGLVRNVGVDVVRDMGADVVIAVDVGTPPAEAEELKDAVGVARQMTILMVYFNAERSIEGLGPEDVLIRPDLGDITTASFDRVTATIPIGEEAARELADALRALSLSPAEYTPYSNRTIPRRESVRIDVVELDNPTGLSDAVVEALIGIDPGSVLTVDELRERLTVVQGVGDFERVDFELVRRGEATGVLVRPQDRSWGTNFFRFGLAIRDNVESVSTFNLLTRFTATRLNRRGGEIRAEAQIGETRALRGEWYQPLDHRLVWFGRVAVDVASELDPLFQGDVAIAQYRSNRGGARLAIGSRLWLAGQVETGLEWEHVRSAPTVGSADLDTFENDVASLFGRVEVDQVDDPRFPTRGTAGFLDVKAAERFLGGDLVFRRVEGRVSPAFSLGRSSLVLDLRAGSSLGTELPFHERFDLGGFLVLSGLQRRQRTGNYMGFGGAAYFFRFTRNRGISPVGGFRVGASVEAGNAWESTDRIGIDDLRLSSSLFFAFDTMIGPVYTAYGWADGGSGSWYFSIGQVF